jgi:Zn-dependent protease with chaperone function
MPLAFYLPLVLPLLAAVAARPLAERLPPKLATWLLAGGAVVLAAASTAALALLALTAVIRIPLVDTVEEVSGPVMRQVDPAPLPVALVAAALLAAAMIAAVLALWRRGEALVAAGREARRLPGRRQVVVLQDPVADAYTLPGLPCRIVITSGMLLALSHAERRVLLAHERAHASGLHFLFGTAARLAAALNPLLRPVAAAIGYTLERWADERAASVTGDRPLAARALARAALASAGTAGTAGPASRAGRPAAPMSPQAMALHAIASPGPVPRRMAALLRPPPRPRMLLVSAAALLVAVACASAAVAASDLHGLLEYAQTAWAS